MARKNPYRKLTADETAAVMRKYYPGISNETLGWIMTDARPDFTKEEITAAIENNK